MNDDSAAMGLALELGLDSADVAEETHEPVDEAQLTEAIREILANADLEQLSRRMIRKQLEAQFHTDLSPYKDMINATILQLIEKQQQDEAGEQEDDEPEPDDDEEDMDADVELEERAPRKKAKAKSTTTAKRKRASVAGDGKKTNNAFNMELSLSPELARVVGAETMARPQIVKALWEYIHAHNLQDPNNKRTIILDQTLRDVFQRDSVTMFSMNKFVKRHVRKPNELPANGWDDIQRDGLSSEDDGKPKPPKKRGVATKRKKSATCDDDDDNEGTPKRANPFNTELALSPELASVLGSDRMARPQIVKGLWKYIHEHELQDPSDKRLILLDNTLRQVFQRDSFTMFSMNKYIKRHARKPADVPAEGWAAIPRDGVSSDEDESKKSSKKKSKAKAS